MFSSSSQKQPVQSDPQERNLENVIEGLEHTWQNLGESMYGTHGIHGTGGFIYIYHKKSTIHVGKYTIPWILWVIYLPTVFVHFNGKCIVE